MILQARILEWISMPTPRGSSQPRNQTHISYVSCIDRQVLYHLLLFSCSIVSDCLRPHGLQHARLLCPLPTLRACSNSYPSSQWCHRIMSVSVVLLSSCLQSFPTSGSFQMNQMAKVWSFSFSISPLGLTGLIRCSPGYSQESSTPEFKSINSSAVSLLYGPTLHTWAGKTTSTTY